MDADSEKEEISASEDEGNANRNGQEVRLSDTGEEEEDEELSAVDTDAEQDTDAADTRPDTDNGTEETEAALDTADKVTSSGTEEGEGQGKSRASTLGTDASESEFGGESQLPSQEMRHPTSGTTTIKSEDEEDEDYDDKGTVSDFGQAELAERKRLEDEIRHKQSTWGAEFDDKDEEAGEDGSDVGGMQELLGSAEKKKQTISKEKEEQQQQKRRRKKKSAVVTKVEKKAKESIQVDETLWVEPEYVSSDFVSGPIVTVGCFINPQIMHFYQSYGYDCLRPYNLHVLDDDTIVYITGNYLHYYKISEQQVVNLRRSASGYGLGHIAIHPDRKHYAVAEKGDRPMIVIYLWPDQQVYRVLENGTSLGFSYVNFSTNGELLCSQGMDPDYLLTIWNWQRERIVLHVKAFSQDIYRATFSTTHPGHLTTCGIGHIRFWKMAQTFTGLKLQGLIGRFGKTEISDITGFVGLQDGKVVSGSEWGNLLVWDGGLIVVEIVQRNGKNCHDGEITDILLLETGEVLTVGLDGFMKLWDSDIIDTADTISDESGKFPVEPIYELKLSSTAKPVSVTKRHGEDESLWMIQDGWGKVWSVSIGTAMKDHEYQPSEIFSCPGGAITCICVCPIYTMMAVGTSTGHLWLIEYITRQTLAKVKYTNGVSLTKLIWLPIRYDYRACSFLAAFSDGNVRLLATHKRSISDDIAEIGSALVDSMPGLGGSGFLNAKFGSVEPGSLLNTLPFTICLLQILRFHKAKINVMKLDDRNNIIYTCAEDKVIFASRVALDVESLTPYLVPLSFVTAPFSVISLDLHPFKDYRMVIASKTGRVAECRRPAWGELGDQKNSYNQGKLHGRRWRYGSVKSARRKVERRINREKELEQKIAELMLDINERRAKGMFVEDELEINRLKDTYKRMQMKDDESEIYVPDKPCPVTAVYYQINKDLSDNSTSRNFFLHVGGYDAGYIYECKCSRDQAGGFHVVPPTPPFQEDVAISSYIMSADNDYLIFGMVDGTLRVMSRRMSLEDFSRQRDSGGKKDLQTLDMSSFNFEDVSRHPSVDENENEETAVTESEETILTNPDPNRVRQKKKPRGPPPFPVTVFPYDLSQFVCLPMHDPNRGAVNDLAWGSEGNFLFSVAEDGSIFSYLWDPEGIRNIHELGIGDRVLPNDETPIENCLEDVQDPNALTLEELKLKQERDRLWELAEGKKEVLRKKIREAKSKFRFLLQKNNEIPEEARISRSRFEIDPCIREPKKFRLMKGIEEIYRRHEWHSAKSILYIEKIQNYFFSEIQTFHMIVKDICHKSQTHTFRHRILTPEFMQLLKQNERLLVQEEILYKEKMEHVAAELTVKPIHVTRVYAKELIGDYEGKKYDVKTLHQIKNLEARLQKRYERQLCWAELNAMKISDDYEDPADIRAIANAKEHLGDYKLKTAETYTGEKISLGVRRQRVIEMKLKIHEHITGYNAFVEELRAEKYMILEECRLLEKQLKKVQRQLPPDLQKPIPPIFDMEPCEEPDKQFDITMEMIRARADKKIEALGLTQRKEKQLEIMEAQSEQMRLAFEASEAVKLGSASKSRSNVTISKVKPKKKKGAFKPLGNTPNVPPTTAGSHPLKSQREKESQSTVKARKAFFKPKTELGNTRLELALQFRCFQQDTILKKLHKLIDYFHERVEKVRDERVALQVDVLLMSMKMLALIQELDIVKEFDSTERAVLERLDAQKVETSEAKDRMDRQQRRLNRITGDYNKLEHGIVEVQKEVAQIIGEKNKFSDFLWKVYKKKIRVEADLEDDDSETNFATNKESSSSSGDSTDSTSQDSGSDLFKLPKQKLNPNVCPDQMDKALFEKVCELRAKRTQLEIEAEAQKKVVQKIERDFVEIQKIYNKYTGRLEGIGEEVQVLQRKKQGKMNQLDSIVILKADQVQCLDEDEFEEFNGSLVQRMKHHFPDIKEVVLFPKDGIGKLDQRIEELKEETEEEREKHKRARHMMVRLSEELTKLEKEVAMINQRCKEEMIAKFGKIVDLDDVCAAIINLEILDELMRLENRRNWHYRERKKIADEIEKARDRLTVLTKENSESNTLLAILIERQRDVEYFLYQQNKKEENELIAAQQKLLPPGVSRYDTDTIEALHIDMNAPKRNSTEVGFDVDIELISNEDALEELFNLEDILTRQESRIMILREAIAACKFKSGLPPLIPLRTIKEDVASCFMTVNELFALRERRNLEIETVYVGENNQNIDESNSKFPSFVSPMESMNANLNFGVPQHTPFDSNEVNESPNVEDVDVVPVEGEEDLLASKVSKRNLVASSPAEFSEDLKEEEDEIMEDEEEEFNTAYMPPVADLDVGATAESADTDEGGQDGERKSSNLQSRPSYPLNVIPDDQMAVAKPDEIKEEIEEEYEGDPIPIAKAKSSKSSISVDPNIPK